MRLKTAIVMLAATSLLPGCLQRFQNNERIPLTCAAGASWADEIVQTAADTYLYAIMANNAYEPGASDRRSELSLPASIELIKRVGNDDVGLAYNLYRKTGGTKPELVLAFRGSEPGRLDWITGNVKGKQLARALEVYDVVSTDPMFADHEISVTGDSLGGSLATQVSLCHPVKIAVSLNTSPRFKSKLCGEGGAILGPNNRHSVTERGEGLKWTRVFGREATQTYTSIDCQSKGVVGDHNVYDLARCLTRIASQDATTQAASVLEANASQFLSYPASQKQCQG